MAILGYRRFLLIALLSQDYELIDVHSFSEQTLNTTIKSMIWLCFFERSATALTKSALNAQTATGAPDWDGHRNNGAL